MWCEEVLNTLVELATIGSKGTKNPLHRIACFSTGQRASSSLLDLTAKFVCTRPDGKERIMKKNQEQLFLRGNDPADTRRMFSYPSSVGGLKGVGGKVGHASLS
jgi:hypothetical protein